MEQIEIITAPDSNNRSSRRKTPERVLQSMLLALNEGRISDAVADFDDQFISVLSGETFTVSVQVT